MGIKKKYLTLYKTYLRNKPDLFKRSVFYNLLALGEEERIELSNLICQRYEALMSKKTHQKKLLFFEIMIESVEEFLKKNDHSLRGQIYYLTKYLTKKELL